MKNFRIAGHGWSSGRGSGLSDSAYDGLDDGFHEDKEHLSGNDSMGTEIADFSDLSLKISNGEIKFCSNCSISVYACRISDSFIQNLGKITGCAVTASSGSCFPGNGNGSEWCSGGQFRCSQGGAPPKNQGKNYTPPPVK